MSPNVSRMAEPARSVSTWSPLRIGVFRAIWIAVLVANVGTWTQTVGAQWLLVHMPHAAILVALVQTADFLPDVLYGLVGGALTLLTVVGQMQPGLLLVFTFALGCA